MTGQRLAMSAKNVCLGVFLLQKRNEVYAFVKKSMQDINMVILLKRNMMICLRARMRSLRRYSMVKMVGEQ